MKNYYEILGVSPDATEEEIEKSIINESRRWNHRSNASTLEKRQEAEKMVALLEKIQYVLTDPDRRKQYDQTLQESKQIRILSQTKLESTASSEQGKQTDSVELETKPEQLPLTTEQVTQSERPPFTTGLVESVTQSEQPSFTTGPVESVTQSEQPPFTTGPVESVTKVEQPTFTTSPIESETKSEQPKGKLRLKKSWLWGIILTTIIISSIVSYFFVKGSIADTASPLVIGQETDIENKFLFEVENLQKENNLTHLKVSIKPAEGKLKQYENTLKQTQSIRDRIAEGELSNKEAVQQFIEKPMIEVTIRMEDEEGNSLGRLTPAEALWVKNVTDQEVGETFEWKMSVFPKSTKYLVIETISGLETDNEAVKDFQLAWRADRREYQIEKRFVLPVMVD